MVEAHAQFISRESDTPRRAGGLMSWAASKAVGRGSRRRASRASSFRSELSNCSIRGLLFADVLAHLFQFEPDGRYCVTAGPEMLAAKVASLPHRRAIAIALF